MNGDQFDVRPFAAGTVVGLRSFDIWGNQLRSVNAEYEWQPGENIAICLPRWGWGDEHERVAGLGCTCGFYAYFGDSNDYSDGFLARVTGIIEGYGTVTLGSRGFRAEKARIIALVEGAGDPTVGSVADGVLEQFGVPVYETVAEALAAHPTTQPQDVGIEPPVAPTYPYTYKLAPGRYVLTSVSGPPYTVYATVSVGDPGTTISSAVPLTISTAPEKPSVVQLRSVVRSALAAPSPEEPAPAAPPARKMRDTERAAEQRRKAGLRGVGGFDKRGRRR